MFKQFTLMFFLLLTFSQVEAQWQKIYTGYANDLYDVQSLGQHAFICGQSSKIQYSKDSGRTWKNWSLTLPCNLRCLYFFDTLTGMVSGENGRVQKTTDGGKTWSQKYVRTAAYTYDITFLGPYGLMVGNELLVTSSDNFGDSWVVDTTFKSSKQLNSVAISKSGYCWAVGDSGIILRKHLSQKKWTALSQITNINLHYVRCFDDSIIVICGGMPDTAHLGVHYNIFLMSRDSGKTWAHSPIPEMKTILSAYFLTPDTGITVGTNGIICKIYQPLYKRGQQLSGTASALNGVTYSDGYGLIVGDGGTLLRTTNFGGFGLHLNSETHPSPRLYPNPASGVVHIESQGPILKMTVTDDLGRTYVPACSDNTLNLENLPKGLLHLQIELEDGVYETTIVNF